MSILIHESSWEWEVAVECNVWSNMHGQVRLSMNMKPLLKLVLMGLCLIQNIILMSVGGVLCAVKLPVDSDVHWIWNGRTLDLKRAYNRVTAIDSGKGDVAFCRIGSSVYGAFIYSLLHTVASFGIGWKICWWGSPAPDCRDTQFIWSLIPLSACKIEMTTAWLQWLGRLQLDSQRLYSVAVLDQIWVMSHDKISAC